MSAATAIPIGEGEVEDTIEIQAPKIIQKIHASTVDPLHISENIVNELLLIYSVIGSTDPVTNKFVPVTDCLNWLQDLQRTLRRDDDITRNIALLLGSWQIVQKKLLPIVVACQYDSALVMTIVKLLVILTKPLSGGAQKAARLVIDVKKSKQKKIVLTDAYKKEHARLKDNALDQAQRLLDYKAAFLDSKNRGALKIIVSLLTEPLARTGSARTETDHMTIELVLHLIRNLLSAGHVSESKKEDARLHQHMIALFQRELVLDIITMLAQDIESRENQHYNLLIMEILHYLFRGQDPSEIASINIKNQRTVSSKSNTQQRPSIAGKTPRNLAPIGSLKGILRAEKSNRCFKSQTTRHGNFGGTIILGDSGNSKRTIGTTSALNPNNTTALESKVARKNKRKNVVFKTIKNPNAVLTSQFSLHTRAARIVLHEFCTGFLKKCYGPLMKSLKNEFRRDSSRLERDDKVNYFCLVRFFSEWHRVGITKNTVEKDQQETINELIFTMDTFSFNLVLYAAESFLDLKQFTSLEKAVSLYLEMLRLLFLMATSQDETENIMALGLLDKLFFNKDPINKIHKLVGFWKVATYSKQYLCDLVELQHIALKILDVYQTKNPSKITMTGGKNDRLVRMKNDAIEFDVNTFFGRLATHHMIFMCSQLLAQYQTNTPQSNHFVVAFFVRLCKFVVVPAEDGDGTLQVTLEPLLYNIHFIHILNFILNDSSIKHEKSFAFLVSFASTIVRHFAVACERNPLLYVECLFGSKHLSKAQCRNLANSYIGDELKSMVERERLLEAQQKELEMENEDDEKVENVHVRRQTFTNDDKGESSDEEDEWKDDEDEVEANIAITKRSASSKWSDKEDEVIKSVVSKALSIKSAITFLLKEDCGISESNRTKKRIKKRMKKLRLHQAGGLVLVASNNDNQEEQSLQDEEVGCHELEDNNKSIESDSIVGDKRKKYDDNSIRLSPKKQRRNSIVEVGSEDMIIDDSMPVFKPQGDTSAVLDDTSIEIKSRNDAPKPLATTQRKNILEDSSDEEN